MCVRVSDAPCGSCCNSVCFQLVLGSQCDSTSHVYLCLFLPSLCLLTPYIFLLVTLPCFYSLIHFPHIFSLSLSPALFPTQHLSFFHILFHIFSSSFSLCPSIFLTHCHSSSHFLPALPSLPSSFHACHLFFHFLTQHLALCMSISGLYLPLPMPASPPPGSHYLSPSLPLSCLCLCLDTFYSRTCPTHMCTCEHTCTHTDTPAHEHTCLWEHEKHAKTPC